MLVLSRQRDETIMIGDNIEITVVDIRGDKVRLGITAPNTIPVHRKEVYEAIQRENREAAKVRMEDLTNLPKGPQGKAEGLPPMRPGRSASFPLTRPVSEKGGMSGNPPAGPAAGPEAPQASGPGSGG